MTEEHSIFAVDVKDTLFMSFSFFTRYKNKKASHFRERLF